MKISYGLMVGAASLMMLMSCGTEDTGDGVSLDRAIVPVGCSGVTVSGVVQESDRGSPPVWTAEFVNDSQNSYAIEFDAKILQTAPTSKISLSNIQVARITAKIAPRRTTNVRIVDSTIGVSVIGIDIASCDR